MKENHRFGFFLVFLFHFWVFVVANDNAWYCYRRQPQGYTYAFNKWTKEKGENMISKEIESAFSIYQYVHCYICDTVISIYARYGKNQWTSVGWDGWFVPWEIFIYTNWPKLWRWHFNTENEPQKYNYVCISLKTQRQTRSATKRTKSDKNEFNNNKKHQISFTIKAPFKFIHINWVFVQWLIVSCSLLCSVFNKTQNNMLSIVIPPSIWFHSWAMGFVLCLRRRDRGDRAEAREPLKRRSNRTLLFVSRCILRYDKNGLGKNDGGSRGKRLSWNHEKNAKANDIPWKRPTQRQ